MKWSIAMCGRVWAQVVVSRGGGGTGLASAPCCVGCMVS